MASATASRSSSTSWEPRRPLAAPTSAGARVHHVVHDAERQTDAGWPGGTRSPGPESRPRSRRPRRRRRRAPVRGGRVGAPPPGTPACRTTPTPTDPNRWLSTGPRPREPSTTRCASSATSSSSVSRGGHLELLLDLDVRRHPMHQLVRLREQRLAVQPQGHEGPGLDVRRVVAPTRRHGPHRAHEPYRPPLQGRLLGGPPDGLAGQCPFVDADDDAAPCAGCSFEPPHVDGGSPAHGQHPADVGSVAGANGSSRSGPMAFAPQTCSPDAGTVTGRAWSHDVTEPDVVPPPSWSSSRCSATPSRSPGPWPAVSRTEAST